MSQQIPATHRADRHAQFSLEGGSHALADVERAAGSGQHDGARSGLSRRAQDKRSQDFRLPGNPCRSLAPGYGLLDNLLDRVPAATLIHRSDGRVQQSCQGRHSRANFLDPTLQFTLNPVHDDSG
jgi:hypothetical protein